MSISLPLDVVTPGTYGALLDLLRSSRSTSRRSALPGSIRELVCVRVSQLNGCAACLEVHVPLAVRAGVEQQRLDALDRWRGDAGFGAASRSGGHQIDERTNEDRGVRHEQWSAEEVAALDLAERLTLTADPQWGDKDELAKATRRALGVLTKEQVAALEWTVVTINAFNRVSIVSELPLEDE